MTTTAEVMVEEAIDHLASAREELASAVSDRAWDELPPKRQDQIILSIRIISKVRNALRGKA